VDESDQINQNKIDEDFNKDIVETPVA